MTNHIGELPRVVVLHAGDGLDPLVAVKEADLPGLDAGFKLWSFTDTYPRVNELNKSLAQAAFGASHLLIEDVLFSFENKTAWSAFCAQSHNPQPQIAATFKRGVGLAEVLAIENIEFPEMPLKDTVDEITDEELLRQIAERDKLENIAAVMPPTFKELGTMTSGRLATQRAVLNSEILWGVGIGDPSYDQSSARVEP